ncbi:UNVERIFIED_ORG: two-component system CheB/CheR fusion protein [Zoogloea ramigera]|uniref:protein-glutamate O-methyltransferase n=1 Tax=Duganella zoogloeoides TaxID=75659 RepID=A0ABZ0XSY3_9BURK|nr:chemotaxis protein CheB [Duganella zoogloeoides]WQH02851.1 CheR family methyltransferase [Duganella zoogloeoides]
MNSPSTATEVPAAPGSGQGCVQAGQVPVVGIGASAGGFDPICEFLASVAPASGFAYVVVQHRDPSQQSILPQLLQRVTRMPVAELAHGMAVQADQVYVAPASGVCGFDSGCFTVRPAEGHHPIDSFFRALAACCGEHAVGITLSGAGADGTIGLAAIRDAGGLTMAQLPASARFDPMPASAIAAKAVDIVALPAEMAAQVANWRRRRANEQAGTLLTQADDQRAALQQMYQLLLQHTGASFADYKLSTVMRRIDRRMKLRQFATLPDYVRWMADNPAEIELLFKELLIGVTSFFRDAAVWDYLGSQALPRLLAEHPDGAAFKAWVPACSTGEEAYSLAIVFDEMLERLRPAARYTLQIFATDLDGDAIDRARQGQFHAAVAGDIAPERLRRYFTPADNGGFRIRKDLRSSIIFARQNLISDPPFTKLDILCCRNLLIYFTPRLQRQLIPLFHYALKRNALLVLGSADTPGRFHELFAPLPGTSRVYRRLYAEPGRVSSYFPTRAANAALPATPQSGQAIMKENLQTQVEQQLLRKHSPAAVLLNADGDILYIHGRTGEFLEPAAGKANWNIHAMARDGLRHELAALVQNAAQTEQKVETRGLIQQDANGRPARSLDITAEAMPRNGPLAGTVLVTFTSCALPPQKRRPRPAQPLVLELEQQLAQARLEIQAVRDEMQASREELKSANEELQSTNEELQSTNEELTTSKEEMQSLNEELYTVNAELQSKVDDLSLINGDMKNLLNSTDIATIFLDNALRIRRYTDQATRIYKLIPGDVQRLLSDIASDLDYPGLEADAEGVLRTLVVCEKHVPTRSGGWYTVRIMPYRTVDNVIDGVVVTFINITEAKQLEAQLRSMQNGAA